MSTNPTDSREVVRRAVKFESPGRLPLSIKVSPGTHKKYGRRLQDLIDHYPKDLGGIGLRTPDASSLDEGTYVDEWGCTWKTLAPGTPGHPVQYPLQDWKDWSAYRVPDPLLEERWSHVPRQVSQLVGEKKYVLFNAGSLFARMMNLRGFENALIDLVAGPPELDDLCGTLEDYVKKTIRRALQFPTDGIIIGDHLAQEDRPFCSPDTYRRRLFPTYRRWIGAVHEAGRFVHFHAGGNVTELLPDFVEMGVDVVKLPNVDMAVTASICRDRVCVFGQGDNRFILTNGTAADVRTHVKRLIETLRTPRGGLIMGVSLGDAAPWENVQAMFQELDAYV